ncbi:MAG: class I mannose-6-phosphate isomerase [Thermogutta sp.]|uniref:type I phosphomannose isomerase catalytic subunit n=1 Tax=Thermogutta sp. TaxID=1962930 RepID=UPI0019A61A8C|nr:type I phosphomannose isomerase catalytic subunit [Thermogutta sp.]MBC7351968.1 class I mannose-6-phosphate isomerase [Thermogutta sp.]
MEPIFFEPFLREQIWGGRQLGSVLGKPLPNQGCYGESWEISAHPLHVSQVKGGRFEGWSLTELWSAFKKELWGEKGEPPAEFPWLIKFLDCRDYLSIQVHPDDALAAILCPAEKGKFEVWTVVEAEPGAKIFAGLKAGVRPDELRDALQRKEPETCLHAMAPRVGDVIVLPPGTVHSAGGGVLVAEVQTPSDATFRLYDWNRTDRNGLPRPLHIEEAVRAINWDQEPCSVVKPREIYRDTGAVGELLVEGPPFVLRRWTVSPGAGLLISRDVLGAWLVLFGSGELLVGDSVFPMNRGDTVLIPGSCPHARWETTSAGRAILLSCHPL